MSSPAQPEAALPQLGPIIGGTLALLTHQARMPSLAAADRIACSLALLARHRQASADVQALCTGLFADWLGPVESQDVLPGREWRDVWPMPAAAQWPAAASEADMPRFAANLSFLYGEHAFLDRFAAAARDGFRAVEFAFGYAHDRHELAARLADRGLSQVLINTLPGNEAAGERGLAALPGREAEFRRLLLEWALPYAQALQCPRIHVMAGVRPAQAERQAGLATFVANLAWSAPLAASAGIELLIEPINPHDIPGYLLNRQDEAHAIVAEVGAPNLKVQMDLYHCARVEGDVAATLRKYLPGGRVGHLQVAGLPGRHEPDRGELQPTAMFALIDELGYKGRIGCEYRPVAGTSAGLGWLAPYRTPQGDLP